MANAITRTISAGAVWTVLNPEHGRGHHLWTPADNPLRDPVHLQKRFLKMPCYLQKSPIREALWISFH